MPDFLTVLRDLPHKAATDVAQPGRAWKVHRADACDGVVVLRHLLFDFEVFAVAEPLHNEVGAEICSSLNSEPGLCFHSDPIEVREHLLGEFNSLVNREKTARFGVIVHHSDNHVAEEFVRLFDDIDMSKVQRIKAAWIHHSLGFRG